jgi:MFS family permease
VSETYAERPATFREVFSSSEYRAIFPASALSWVGDFLAKAAVTALVYNQTGSTVASAATFAISFLPWVCGGPVLAAVSERYPSRTVMVIADLGRMALILLVAVPWMPVPGMLVLLFLTALLNPPFDAARSALLPRVLSGDRYVVGMSLQSSANQAAQLVGYLVGSAVGASHPRAALLIDAVTFAFSACMIGFGVRHRPGVLSRNRRSHLLRETGQGFRVVFGTPTLRAIAILVLACSLFTMAPEGLAAAWAATLETDPGRRGLVQGIIMIANPLGYLITGLLIGRLIPPATRRRLIRPFATLAPVVLIPALLRPDALLIALMAGLCGVCLAAMTPAANALFVQVLPGEYRARAHGVMQSGLQVAQGLGVLVTGLFAGRFALHTVIGEWSVVGAALMLVIGSLWPTRGEFADAVSRTRSANAEAEAAQQTAGATLAGQRSPAGEPHPSAVHRAAESM